MHRFRGTPSTTLSLADAPVATPVTVASQPADPAAAQRLLALGWRPGAQVAVVRRTTGGARVIELSGARVALGGRLARELRVAPQGRPAA